MKQQSKIILDRKDIEEILFKATGITLPKGWSMENFEGGWRLSWMEPSLKIENTLDNQA